MNRECGKAVAVTQNMCHVGAKHTLKVRTVGRTLKVLTPYCRQQFHTSEEASGEWSVRRPWSHLSSD